MPILQPRKKEPDPSRHLIGLKVVMMGDHPRTGEYAEIIDCRSTSFGVRPVMRNALGDEFYAMKPGQWKLLN